MKFKSLLIFLIILTSCKTTETKKKSLFNGKDLTGWNIHGTEKWYIENELLVCENGIDENFGYLATDKNYKNFELNLEFKRNTKGNGGVFLHSIFNDTKINGWQVEIGLPGHFTGGIHKYETGWIAKPDLIKDEALKIGEWNKMKIIVKDDKATVWLNNTEMVSITDPNIITQEGTIALQIHKGNKTKIQWRNINIIEL